MENFNTEYLLKSVITGSTYNDTGWMLEAPGETEVCLLRSVYKKNILKLREDSLGIFKFADWLPLKGYLKGSSSPVTYKSAGLAKELGLENLWITFNGYWPERGALMTTCSFKETEAFSVCSRLNGYSNRILVVASAGNTARAFARVCSENHIPLLLCVPEDYIDALWFEKPLASCVKLIATESGSDYFDAIALSNVVAGIEGFTAEGGAKNIARRDGMGTTVLNSVCTIGQIPDYYFQAVGSGTGAIAAWEANMRLIEDGSFGNNKMRLMVSQNAPFQIIYDSWKARSRSLVALDDDIAREQAQEIKAKVLSNRRPPYSIAGGLFDALVDTNGDVLIVSNDELQTAKVLFQELEGIDIHPAAAVATASLIQAVKDGIVNKSANIMLNITGGGEELFKSQFTPYYLKPHAVISLNTSDEQIIETVKNIVY